MKTYKTIFFGTPEFAVPVLECLLKLSFIDLLAVVTQPDKPVGKKQTITPPPVKTFALKNNLTVLQPASIKSSDFIKTLKKYQPDVVVIIAYGKIITKQLLEIPQYGWLNIHASLLPNYRGASPIQAAILAGDGETGVTLMKINQGLDTGPVISQLAIPIAKHDNAETLHDKLSQLGGKIVAKDLLNYLKGDLPPQNQTQSPTPVCKTIKKEDGQINWNNSAEKIERQIRAYTPWPGTYCYWNDKRLKIIEASVSQAKNSLSPGEVSLIDNKIVVGCGKNSLELKIIQLAGKKPMNIQSFIKGYPDFGEAKLT
ncbi:MAG: methionyl-tRNA formyltransferase [bacterium]|nr:methionyl-tRNA formyltransferase [bacterium]